MNRFLKTNSPWLGLLGLALLIVVMAFIFRPISPEYQIGATETLSLINDQSNKVELKDLAGKQLIDIRPSILFEQGHAENAINLPIKQLLDKESIKIINELSDNGKEVVLYGSDELQATAPFILLRQLGYKNLKIVKGGFTSLNEFKEPSVVSTEVSIVDTTAMKVKPEQASTTDKKVEMKKTEAIVPVRKAASTGGGC